MDNALIIDLVLAAVLALFALLGARKPSFFAKLKIVDLSVI